MYKLLVSKLTHQHLDNIVSYIAVQLANPKAAGDYFDLTMSTTNVANIIIKDIASNTVTKSLPF